MEAGGKRNKFFCQSIKGRSLNNNVPEGRSVEEISVLRPELIGTCASSIDFRNFGLLK